MTKRLLLVIYTRHFVLRSTIYYTRYLEPGTTGRRPLMFPFKRPTVKRRGYTLIVNLSGGGLAVVPKADPNPNAMG